MDFICKYEKYSGLSSRNLTKSIQMQFLVSIKLVCCVQRRIFSVAIFVLFEIANYSELVSIENQNEFFE